MSRILKMALVGIVLAGCDLLGGDRDRGLHFSTGDELTLQIADRNGPPAPIDEVTITAATLLGDHLVLDIRYGGGCGTHRLAASAGPEIGESNPPYAAIRLIHDGGGDLCQALISRRIEIDVRPIQALVAPFRAVRLKPFDGSQASSVAEVLYQF